MEKISAKDIKINDSFWSNKINIVKNNSLVNQWEILNDNVIGQEPSYCIRNFKLAKEINRRRGQGENVPVIPIDKWHYTLGNSDQNSFLGWVFQDSDLYKWLESVSYVLQQFNEPQLKEKAAWAIDLITSCALPNGYIDTLHIINNPEKIFTNLKDNHELYCFAHLAEAGIAYYNATKETKLLNTAVNFANLICDVLGEGKKEGYPGHPIAEYALIELYKVTGNKKFLRQSELFIERRGTEPFYFDIERNIKTDGHEYVYNQADKPIKSQNDAHGHAVRAMYLYTGVAALQNYTYEEELYNSCKRIFENITQKRMYITGGIGSTADGEAFTYDYNLPNDTAYCESCASIGLMMFAREMLFLNADSKYADIMERCLYNCVLSGISEDGLRYFYTNPLEISVNDCHCNKSLEHVKTMRQEWFGCACCPTNITRTIGSVGEYCFSEGDNTAYINMFISADVKTSKADISIKSDFLNNGQVSLNIKKKKNFILAVRIPEYCKDYKCSKDILYSKNGYVYFEIKNDEKIEIEFNIKIQIIKCNNHVRNNIGKVALQRGPIIYCLESSDIEGLLDRVRLSLDDSIQYENGFIYAKGYVEEKDYSSLYTEFTKIKERKINLTFNTYYMHSGDKNTESDMKVWVRI